VEATVTRTYRTIAKCLHGLALAALLALPGCAARDVLATDDGGYVADAAQRVAAIDWDRAETVSVALSEYDYAPSILTFHPDMPYHLHLTNQGFEAHDFSSKPFFQAVAAAKLVDFKTTKALPRLVSIGIDPGEAKDLYFVPVRPGSYPFACDEPLHATLGMTGTARIE
jgi:uncharacterized cupredoxin-like copper-binding protein